MDAQQLEAKRQEALAAGYSEEDIQQYLQSLPQPGQPEDPIQQVPMDRSEEYMGLAQGMGLDTATKVVEYGVPAAAAYYGAKKIFGKGPVAPAAQVTQQAQVAQQAQQATGTGGRAFNNMANSLTKDNTIRFPGSPAAPQMQPGIVDHASSIVRKLALSKLLPAAQVGMGLFYTSPEEIATLKAAEELRKRQGLTR